MYSRFFIEPIYIKSLSALHKLWGVQQGAPQSCSERTRGGHAAIIEYNTDLSHLDVIS